MVAVRQDHFPLAEDRTFRNLLIMRQLLFLLMLAGVLSFARVADAQALKTNNIPVGTAGTLQISTPPDWTFTYTNLGLPEKPITFELHARSNSIVIRYFVRWDGFGGTQARPNESAMGLIVSNSIAAQYLQMSVEKSVKLENLAGPDVSGVFARITDANWSPIMKNEYPNFTEGMFRCRNIWGNFNLLTFDKDGPGFKAGLQVLQSMRRKPGA
jgi:hypothetical protein